MKPTFITTCLILIALCQPLFAQPGTLDPTFGNQGVVSINIGQSSDYAGTVLVQPDGKVIVAGSREIAWYYSTFTHASIARCMPDGTLDPSFGTAGIAVVSFGSATYARGPAVLQPDGKVIITGSHSSSGGEYNIVAARLKEDGTLDASFGDGGKLILELSTSYGVPTAAAVQSDGKIVIAGYVWGDSSYAFCTVRINADGSADSTFGTAGTVITSIVGNDFLFSMDIQNDNRIIVMGTGNDTANAYASLARYNSNGSLDSTFSGDGISTFMVPGTLQGSALAGVLPGGRMIVAGATILDSTIHYFLSRVDQNGLLDSSFGTNGIQFPEADGKPLVIGSVLVSSDGEIVCTGAKPLDGSSDAEAVLARYDSNGVPDATFGSNGILAVNTTAGYDVGSGLDIQDDGTIVYGAISTYEPNIGMETARGFMVLRSTSVGTLDNSWGNGGITTTLPGSGNNEVARMVLQGDGRIVAASTYYNGNNSDFSVARFSSDGVPDASFGDMGRATAGLSDGYMIMQAGVLAVQSDGGIVVGGEKVIGPVYQVALSRFTKDGLLDTRFGTGGTVFTSYSDGDDGAYAGAVQPDDKIVVVGYSLNGTEYQALAARYLPDGMADSSFGTNGYVRLSYGTSNDFSAMAIQPDGKIVAAGRTNKGGNNNILLVRLNPDGTLDQGFGTNGATITNISAGDDGAYSMALQNDGRIVLGGFVHPGTTYDAAVLRYNANGTPDLGFGESGRFITVFTPAREEVLWSLAIQQDGKILAGGYSGIFSGSSLDSSQLLIYRLNQDGTLDNSFAANGVLISAFGAENPGGAALGIQSTGKIVAGAGFGINNQYDMGIVRLESGLSLDVDREAISGTTARVFPNRLAEYSTLEFETVQRESIQISLVDMQGNTALEIQPPTVTGPGRHVVRFHTAGLVPGTYILKIRGESGDTNIKVTR